MGLLDRFTKTPEVRVQVTSSAENFFEKLGLPGWSDAAGVSVTVETALTVPAFAAGVNFLSRTMATLPIHVYRYSGGDRKRVGGAMETMLKDRVNPECSSYEFRKHMFEAMFTHGRGVAYIERNSAGNPTSLWPMDTTCVEVERVNMRRVYHYNDGASKKTYDAADIIDMPWMLKSDMLTHRSPVKVGKLAIAMGIAAKKYGEKFFLNGGVPPFAVTGNFQSGAALDRASKDFQAAIKKAAAEGRQALTLPMGMDIKSIGTDADKAQLLELQQFTVVEIARLLNLPPIVLQDLSHGTFANTEQQDLHLSKHTISHIVKQFEQELNLKMFPAGGSKYIEMNLDGLLRGDFKTRMEGYSTGIQSGVIKPAEARAKENLEADDVADNLFIQGGTVPMKKQLEADTAPPQPSEGNDDG